MTKFYRNGQLYLTHLYDRKTADGINGVWLDSYGHRLIGGYTSLKGYLAYAEYHAVDCTIVNFKSYYEACRSINN